MKIAAFGSWIVDSKENWKSTGKQEQFKEACNAIGKAIIAAGHEVIVGSSRESTADKHVVDGVLAALPRTEREVRSITVIRPYEEVAAYAELSEKYLNRFLFIDRPGLPAAAVKVLAVADADAVITIGGGAGTYMAGLAAMMAKKPLIPIGSFGGASRQLIAAARAFDQDAKPLDALNAPWGPGVLQWAETIAGLRRPATILLIHGRSNDWEKLRSWLSDELKVNVIVMKEQFGDGKTLPEKFEQLAWEADGAIALATPDDFGGLASRSAKGKALRARENVWIEYGWFWGRLGRSRILLLHKGDVRVPSDLNGLEYNSYSKKPTEHSETIRVFIERLGCGGRANSESRGRI
ncbi:TIR domain-containing protein [Bradyrhizobium algeriense]|uniref:TIR domain-containing protein n=1 Tax=Bradyrhizobium algeriense TaxID=634784 RepID=UPI00167CB666|nr:TIR domain-containing protein [Bradyrhizobium algeriense]